MIVEIELSYHVILIEEPCRSLLYCTDQYVVLFETGHNVSGINGDVFVCAWGCHFNSNDVQFYGSLWENDKHDVISVNIRIVMDIEVVRIQGIHPRKLCSHVVVVMWDGPTESHFT